MKICFFITLAQSHTNSHLHTYTHWHTHTHTGTHRHSHSTTTTIEFFMMKLLHTPTLNLQTSFFVENLTVSFFLFLSFVHFIRLTFFDGASLVASRVTNFQAGVLPVSLLLPLSTILSHTHIGATALSH